MKKIGMMFAFVCSIVMMGCLALAQIADPVIPPVTDTDFIGFLIQSLGGLKGASTLAIVAIVVQILIKFLGTDLFGKVFKNVSGAVKLLIVTGLSLVAGVVGLMSVEGLTIGAALVHSTTMTAFMVFANQLYKQFFVKAD